LKETLDIVYRNINGITLYLDLFLPEDVKNPPLIFWIHGGAWKMGDRKWCGLKNQIERGFAVTSVDYRLSGTAPFPACIEDCKYALAFLRKNSGQYPINFSKVCAAGDSAGGHLAALMGVTTGHEEWEPEGADCSVQAVIDLYGPAWIKRKYPLEQNQNNDVIDALLGISVVSTKGIMAAVAASPVTYIDGTEPPFLIIHGDQDDVVSIEDSRMLRNELEKHGRSVSMYTVLGGSHGFNRQAVDVVINDFLDYQFKNNNKEPIL